MAQNALIVYATGSRLPRRLIIPDDDTELLSLTPFLGPGESGRVFPQARITALANAARLAGVDIARMVLANLLGIAVGQIPSGRCCVIDPAGSVVNVIVADPALDQLDGHTLVAHDQAGIGWAWDGTRFVPPPKGMVAIAEIAALLPVAPSVVPVPVPVMAPLPVLPL